MNKQKSAAFYEALNALKQSHTIIHRSLGDLENGGNPSIYKPKIALAISMAANALAKLE